MSSTSAKSVLRRLRRKLRRIYNNNDFITTVVKNLKNEDNWQKMVDYIEYAEKMSNKLDPKRILVKSLIFSLRKAPSVLREVKRTLL